QRAVLVEQRAQGIPLDRHVARGLDRDSAQIGRLVREQVHLSHEAACRMARDLVTARVENHRPALQDRYERMRITDLEQGCTGGGFPWSVAARAGSQFPSTWYAPIAECMNRTAASCGSPPATASRQSRTCSPSAPSHRASAGSSVTPSKPAGAGYAKA